MKNRFYSIINISGLAVGLTVGILILLWVQDERSYDKFHSKQQNIYKLENMAGTGPSRSLWTVTASAIGVLAKKEIPGVEDVVRICYNANYGLYRYEDKTFAENNTFYTDPSLFRIFDYTIVRGNSVNPFPDNNSIVINESTAAKYFGSEEPIGKVIIADDKVNFKVTAVIKDMPKNSTFQADILFPMSLNGQNLYAENKDGRNLENDFIQYNYTTFMLFKPGFSFEGLTKKLRDIHLRVKSNDTDVEYLLLPLAKMHLYRADGGDNGNSVVKMFTIIAIIILVIACINYVNLSTARSMLRAKEVSLRKIVGAARMQLFAQFIIETTLLFLFATIIALTLVFFLIPVFNRISGKEIILDFGSINLWQVIMFTILGTLVISSIYPALLLSSFQPIKALKGRISARLSNVMFRKSLVVVQFSFSIILMAGALIIGNQLKYIRDKKLGYNKEHVLSCRLIDMKGHLDVVRDELLKQPGISNVTTASINIVRYDGHTGNNSWEGKEEGETLMLSPMAVDSNFISFFSMQLKEGKGFTGSIADSTHFILNETAVKAARIESPIGKKFKLWETEGTITGVVKDFHFTSLKQKIEPAIFFYRPSNYNNLYIKTTAADAPKAIAALEKQWKKYNPKYAFNYAFLDEQFDDLYKSEERTGLLFNIFSIIAIFISCLGLFGLAAYTAQVRTREIGVRKVLGASVLSITRLLAKDFVRLVIIALAIGIPVTWYMMNKWLEDFAYKTQISWLVFAITGLLAILIAVATISFQSVKAAMLDPVKSLRSE